MNDLGKIEHALKSGEEFLTVDGRPLGYKLFDFWRWSVSDLLSNATRGRLAEFIVATAADVDISVPRDEWAAFDLVTTQGVKIEVKSAAYVQSWFQRAFSKISFSIKPALYWDSHTNKQSKTAIRSADVYIFCLLHLQDKKLVNPLNLDHWEFYILSTKELDGYTRSTSSITLKSLQKLTTRLTYHQIKEVVQNKYETNK